MDSLASDLRGGRLGTVAGRALFLAALGVFCCFSAARADTTPPHCKVEDPNESCRTKLPGAELRLSPAIYSFSARGLDLGPSTPAAFVLTNTGTPLLTVGSVKLSWSDPEGADPELFAFSSDNCGVLESGESCTIEITFDPALPGLKQGTLTVVDTTQSATASIQLEGSGRVVVLSPPSLTFGAHEVDGATTPPQLVTVINTSRYEPVTLYALTLAGDPEQGASQFRIVGGSCGPTLIIPPLGRCAVDVAFLPSAAGSHEATLQLIDSAPEVLQSSVLEGEGVSQVLSRPRGLIVRHPAKRTVKQKATFEFSGNPAAREFECRLDARPFGQCESPISFYKLHKGRHTFEVRAVDTVDGDRSEAVGFGWRIVGKHP